MKKELNCKTGLKKNIIKKDVFEREIALCRKLARKNRGKCSWGKCKGYGVIPFLYKLHKGELLEDPKIILKLKTRILK